MKKAFIIYTLFLTPVAFSQTKTIAHKRHNGDVASLKTILHGTNWEVAPSNFGLNPSMEIIRRELKEVILINDSTNAMVIVEENGLNITSTDTVINYNYMGSRYNTFSRKTPIDSMKKVLKKEFFTNDIEEVKFTGFKKPEKSSEENSTPLTEEES